MHIYIYMYAYLMCLYINTWIESLLHRNIPSLWLGVSHRTFKTDIFWGDVHFTGVLQIFGLVIPTVSTHEWWAFVLSWCGGLTEVVLQAFCLNCPHAPNYLCFVSPMFQNCSFPKGSPSLWLGESHNEPWMFFSKSPDFSTSQKRSSLWPETFHSSSRLTRV